MLVWNVDDCLMIVELMEKKIEGGGGPSYRYLERLIDRCSLKQSVDIYLICLILNFLAHHRRGADRPEHATSL